MGFPLQRGVTGLPRVVLRCANIMPLLHSPLRPATRLAHAWLLSSCAVILAGAAPLTEQAALERALEANFSLQVEALTPEIAAAQVQVEESAFLPSIFAEANYEDNEKSQNSIDFAALQQRLFTEENTVMRSGLGGKLPWGTQYELSVQLSELDNSVNRAGLPNALFSPEYVAFTGLTLRQPLLRGFGRGTNLSTLRVARSQLVITDRTRQVAVNNKCVEVLNAFYDLAYAKANVEVKTSAVAVAERFLKETQRRRELGMLSPVDVSEAQVRVSEANEELLRAQDFHRERQLELVRLLALESGPDGSSPRPEVAAELLDAPPVVQTADFYPAALDRRPDYLLAGERIEQEKYRRTAARNERLPQLDVHFSYGLHGLQASYSDAFDTALKAHEPQWGVGLSLNIPLSPREGRAKLAAARLRVRQAELQRTELQQRIALEVENAVRRLDVLGQRLATARSSVNFASEGLRLEEARLEQGQTSGFAVAELQRRLADARTRELAARVDLTKAVTELWSVSGLLLEKHGILIADSDTVHRGFSAMAPFDAMMR